MDKSVLRKQFLLQRDQMTPEAWRQANDHLQKNVLRYVSDTKPEKFFLFAGFRQEPNIFETPICEHLWRMGAIYLPVVDPVTMGMDFFRYERGEALQTNIYGIPEPSRNAKLPEVPGSNAVLFVPALAVDLTGHRLGYGKGYYDRYLAIHHPEKTVCLAFEDFLVDCLPAEDFDRPVGAVITDKRRILIDPV